MKQTSKITQRNPAQKVTKFLTRRNSPRNQDCYKVERYNSKMNLWTPMYLAIKNNSIYFYETRPNSYTPIKDYFSLEKIKFKFHKIFKQNSQEKPNVISFQMTAAALSSFNIEDCNYNLFISFKDPLNFLQAQKDLNSCSSSLTKKPAKLGRTRSFNLIGENKENININIANYNKNIPKKNTHPHQRTKSLFEFSTDKKDMTLKPQAEKKEKSRNALLEMKKLSKIPSMGDLNNFTEKEENTSLISLINQMMTSSSKKKKKNFYNLGQSSSSTSTSSSISSSILQKRYPKRKEQLNTLINLSFINENNSHILPVNEEANIIDASSSNANVVTLGNDDEKNLESITSQMESYSSFIYDPYILNSLLTKGAFDNKKDLGKIFLSVQKEEIKKILMIEMISRLSKTFLTKSITKSLEVILKEKEMNPNFVTQPSNPHSFEYCICDIFNTFLGKNHPMSSDLYEQVLPYYINERYGLGDSKVVTLWLQKIKSDTTKSLLISMEYHNRIYFEDAVNIDLNSDFPFKHCMIKYISPYMINKWHIKANESISTLSFLSGSSNKKSEKSNFLTSPFSSTNAKRISNIVPKCTKLQNSIFKSFESSENENRIIIVNSIYKCIVSKEYSTALKLCDYYVQRYTDTIYLNSVVYMYLAEIYNEIENVDIAKMFIEKSIHIIKNSFGENYFFYVIYYNYFLIMMKQNDGFIRNNFEQIKDIMKNCEEYSKKYLGKVDSVITMQKMIFYISYGGKEMSEKEVEHCYNIICECMSNIKKGQALYWSLLIDLFKGMKNSKEEIIKDMIKRLCAVNKEN